MNKIDYNREYEKTVAALVGRPRLLLHVCCAPCLAAGILSLAEHFDITLYYDNPNIFPSDEYEKRRGEIEKLTAALGLDIPLVALPYDRKAYDEAVGDEKGGAEGGNKCRLCCASRLARTAEKAAKEGYDYFSTTLTASPLKDAAFLNGEMARLSETFGVKFLPCDFKKKDGNLRSRELCAKFGIYRQHYCGCTPPRLTVAVTGGIASGKSTLTGMFSALGAYTIDADRVTRKLQEEGESLCEEIKRAFPEAVKDGRLDRAALKAAVFADPNKRRTLEATVHPAVIAETERLARRADSDIVVIEIPLLAESGMTGNADVIVNVAAPLRVRAERAAARDGMSEELFASVVRAQASELERMERADVTVINDGDLSHLERTAKELMQKWRDRQKQA